MFGQNVDIGPDMRLVNLLSAVFIVLIIVGRVTEKAPSFSFSIFKLNSIKGALKSK
jgi:hypothetical protein